VIAGAAGNFLLLGGKPLGLAFGDRMEGGRCVIEQDFLSGVDLVRLDAVFVAEVRDGHFIDQIPLEIGHLLVRVEVSSLHTHEILLVWGVILT
jgi:hypothetical protein